MQTNESQWLSAEEAVQTARYFQNIVKKYPALPIAVQALFGGCCLAQCAGSGSGMEELRATAANIGRVILTHPDPNKLALDPLLIIEIYTMLQQGGEKVQSIADVLERMTAELVKQRPEIRSTGRVRHIASRLAALGYAIEAPKAPRESTALVKSPESWLTASLPALADLADHLIADCRELDDLSCRILSLIALAELRNYRIDAACNLLRVVLQLGTPCPEADEAINFIALQRRRDGYYGFSNQLAESSEPGMDKHLSLFMPLTLNAVWLFRVKRACQPQASAATGALA